MIPGKYKRSPSPIDIFQHIKENIIHQVDSPNLAIIKELAFVKAENAELLSEIIELRKMVGLLQKNLKLRMTIREYEVKVRNICTTENYSNIRAENGQARHSDPRQGSKHKENQCLAGEIAFQLDQRIICSVFKERHRNYGFLVSNIEEMIHKVTTCPLSNKVDKAQRSVLYHRYHKIFKKLKQLGYDKHVHPSFAEYLVNTYGTFKERLLETDDAVPYLHNPKELRRILGAVLPGKDLADVYILLDCLVHIAEDDGKPLFRF